MRNVNKQYEAVCAACTEMEAVMAWPDDRLFQAVPAVSNWSAAHHLVHLLKVDLHFLEGLLEIAQGEAETEGRPTMIGRALLGAGKIPRGKGRAPKAVQPPEAVSRVDLAAAWTHHSAAVTAVEPVLAALQKAPGRIRHPVFGHLDAGDVLRFVEVHARHHLAIIHDVDAAQS